MENQNPHTHTHTISISTWRSNQHHSSAPAVDHILSAVTPSGVQILSPSSLSNYTGNVPQQLHHARAYHHTPLPPPPWSSTHFPHPTRPISTGFFPTVVVHRGGRYRGSLHLTAAGGAIISNQFVTQDRDVWLPFLPLDRIDHSCPISRGGVWGAGGHWYPTRHVLFQLTSL